MAIMSMPDMWPKSCQPYFGLPFVFTGHSLGRSKKERLLAPRSRESVLNRQLKIDYRIEMEEKVLQEADLIVTSTKQEVETQYGAYQNKNQPEYQVIPPGICIEKFEPFYYGQTQNAPRSEEAMFAKASMLNELDRFFQNPDKPMILMLCRPGQAKKHSGADPGLWGKIMISKPLQSNCSQFLMLFFRSQFANPFQSGENEVASLATLTIFGYGLDKPPEFP